jgi:uncharacterized protein
MAEGNPHADRSSLAAPLEAVTRLVLRSPGLVLGGSVMLAVLAVLITVNGLSFKTSRLDLLNPRSEYNQRWLGYLAEFGRRDDAVCVVRSDDPEALTAAIDDLAAELARQPDLFESIFSRRDLSALKRKGLHFIPDAELAQIEQQVRHGVALIPRAGQPADPAAALAQLNDRLAHVGTANPQIRQALEGEYQRIAGMTLAAVAGGGNQSVGIQPASALVPADGTVGAAAARLLGHGSARVIETRTSLSQTSPSQASPERLLKEFEPQYLLADKGRLGFVLLKLKVDESSFTRGSLAIRQLRQTIAKVRPRHPAAWIGLTGMPIIEYDEMQASQTDMIWTSLVSMIAVFGLFIAGYGGLRHSLLANLVLLLATAYSFGFVTLAVGHLNILSAAFSAVLIGLGIDFGIHYLACYLKLRGEGYDEEAALIRTTLEVGPGMFTGGVTTAAAFFMAAMTDFVGVRELGLVAGGSILLCVAATVVVLPPLVLVVDRQWPIGAVPQIVPAGRWFAFTGRWPRLVMGASLLVTVAIAVGCGWLRYDHNLLNLQPKHLESADIERELFAKLDDSVWFAVTLCDSREDLLAKKALFEKLPTVSKTEEIASLLPASTPERQQLITATGQHLATLPSQEPEPVKIDPHRLKSEVARAQALLARETPVATPTIALVQQLGGALSQMPDDFVAARLTNTQADLAQQSFAQLAVLRELADPTPPQLADLPRELADRFVGAHHKLLLKVYAHGIRPRCRIGRSARHRPPRADLLRLAAHAAKLHLHGTVCPRGGVRAPLDRPAEHQPFAPGDGPVGDGVCANVRRVRLVRHSAQSGQHDRAAGDPGDRRRSRRAPGACLASTAGAVSRGRFDSRGRALDRNHHDGQLRHLDPGPAPGAPVAGAGAHDRRDDLPVFVDRILPGGPRLDDAPRARRAGSTAEATAGDRPSPHTTRARGQAGRRHCPARG